MPLNPSTTTPMFLAALTSANVVGQGAAQLAAACAAGLQAYATSGVQVVTIDVGTLGSGTGVGSGLVLPPPAASSAMIAAFSAAGIVGTHAAPTATAIGLALAQALAAAIVQSVHAGVGVGSGIIQLIPNPGVSVPSFIAAFTGAGLAGVSASQMATAVAAGVDSSLPSVKGVVVISGAGSMYPGSGAGKGVLL